MELEKITSLLTSKAAAPIFIVVLTLFLLVRCVATSRPDYKSDPNIDQLCAEQVAKEVKSYGYGTKARRRYSRRVDSTVKEQCSIKPTRQQQGINYQK